MIVPGQSKWKLNKFKGNQQSTDPFSENYEQPWKRQSPEKNRQRYQQIDNFVDDQHPAAIEYVAGHRKGSNQR